ncbi:hypothetical protein VTK73DRAFT_3903 [Phialemonium thermophilum]|uniref:SET domain-containing protein n=1 Tax=Phialemonium thermophilum TaxID=223376 RepID=A0ABR3WWF7_9PEZI
MLLQETAHRPAATETLVGKVPPRRLTREELLRTHKSHLKKQTVAPDAPRPVKQPVLEQRYPASTKSIRELEIIPLSELRVETHHRGQGIIVRVITPPYLGAGVVSLVEDQFGNVDKLAVYNHSDSSILSGVPEGFVLAVKEPYYKHNGNENDYMVSVDHPSDVILLRFTDPIIPEPLRLGPLLKSAEEWRTAGDKAFIDRDFPPAIFCYTEALDASDDESFKAGVLAKRAGTNLVLGRYDAAKADALASRTGAPSDWKAYYTAGRASYGLCDYRTSREYLEKALELNPGAAAPKKEYARCLARLREEETGDYDFRAMFAGLSPKTVHVDCGSFLSNTRVHESPLHGRGLYAARDIKAGEIVFVEKATFMPNQYEPARASAALYAAMVHQLYDNPSLGATVLQLYDGGIGRTGGEGATVDGVPVVDVFVLEGIRTKNCFSAPLSTLEDTKPSVPSGRMAKGLWAHASYMNHSCVPNSMRSFLGDMLVSRATRDIAAGEEIFQQYVPVKALLHERLAVYRESWGFECRCPLCDGEKRSAPEKLARRRELLRAVEKSRLKRHPGKGLVPDAAIRTVDRLMRQLEDMHEPDVFRCLPRLALVHSCNYLLEAHLGRKNYAKAARYGRKLLRNFGFPVPEGEDDDREWDPRTLFDRTEMVPLMTIHVVATLRYLVDSYKALGRTEMADRCLEAARFGYKIVTGFEDNVNKLDE